MCNLSWTPHSNLEKDNSLKTTPVLAQRWAVWSILTKNQSFSGAVKFFYTVEWSNMQLCASSHLSLLTYLVDRQTDVHMDIYM